jgi:hypothetical protein
MFLVTMLQILWNLLRTAHLILHCRQSHHRCFFVHLLHLYHHHLISQFHQFQLILIYGRRIRHLKHSKGGEEKKRREEEKKRRREEEKKRKREKEKKRKREEQKNELEK